MKQRRRIYYTETDKALMWERWQKGDNLHAIARLFDRGHSPVQRILSETGGIRPPRRSRSRLTLTTQMYFAGDRHLGADRLLKNVPKPEQKRLIIEPTRRSGANSEDLYTFDVHLLPLIV